MKTVRDDRLGAALRELEAPEHRPSFHAELERLLAAEAAERRPVRKPHTTRRWALRAAAVAAMAAVAVVTIDLVRSTEGPGPSVQTASAAEIQARMRTALADLETLSGELFARGRSYENAYGWDSRRWSFLLTDRGDFRLTGLSHEENLSYNARRGVQRTLNTSESLGTDDLFAMVRRGIAPGPPDSYPAESILMKDFGALVRASWRRTARPSSRRSTKDGRRGDWTFRLRSTRSSRSSPVMSSRSGSTRRRDCP